MAFYIRHLMGNGESSPPLDRLPALLDELENAEDEHPDVSLTHESGWGLSVFASGLVIFENVEEGNDPRHRRRCKRSEILTMFEELARGDLAALNARRWRPGYK